MRGMRGKRGVDSGEGSNGRDDEWARVSIHLGGSSCIKFIYEVKSSH